MSHEIINRYLLYEDLLRDWGLGVQLVFMFRVTDIRGALREVMRLNFYLPKFFFFSNYNIAAFKVVPVCNYTPTRSFFSVLVARCLTYRLHSFVTIVQHLLVSFLLKLNKKVLNLVKYCFL